MFGRLLFNVLIVCSLSVFSQQYNYSLTTDIVSYSTLQGDSILATGSNWSDSYTIEPGFTIPFCGSSFNYFSVERNNYLSFDRERKFSLLAFPGFFNKNCLTRPSSLSIKVDGTAPSRVCKLQVANVGQVNDSSEYLNYQIWLYESGRIDIITGSHSYPVADSVTLNDTLNPVQIGLVNTTINGAINGLFLSGSPSSPMSVPFSSGSEMSLLRSVPIIGTRYSFLPIN